jgi:hypothetical protein
METSYGHSNKNPNSKMELLVEQGKCARITVFLVNGEKLPGILFLSAKVAFAENSSIAEFEAISTILTFSTKVATVSKHS